MSSATGAALGLWRSVVAPLSPPAAGPLGIGDDATGRKNMLLLIQLRWIAVVGQLVTILIVQLGLGVPLPIGAMVTVQLTLMALNAVSLVRLRFSAPVSNGELFLAMVLDVAALTVQLYLSGGATNPFISLFLLQVTLGAVLLEGWPTLAIASLASLCFLSLSLNYVPLHLVGRPPGELFRLHIWGMVVCFGLDAALLVLFVARISRNLRARDARVADLRQREAEEDHIVRMGLLASGAAHELGTPLATVAVILSDWKRLPALQQDAEMQQELRDMEAEIQRCKAIVTGILTSAGEMRGEGPVATTIVDFLDDVVTNWRSSRPALSLEYLNKFGHDLEIVSDSALQQVLFNVLDNAAEASPRWVSLEVSRREDILVLQVCDAGAGFSPSMLANFAKPYASSKGRLGGGLGLFLVVNVVRKLGGAVSACNRAQGGAAVTLTLPLSALQIRLPNG